ncbi:MAG: pilus assembly protein PilM [Candidatus Omnitrophica bacterium]|nr:pilus assembly protein PilM [Candidatus Omnitrophota bacterium]
MGESKQSGIFWGRNSLSVVGVTSGKPSTIFSVPLPREASVASIEAGPFSPMGMEIVSIVQNALRQHKMSSGAAYVSLPTKDIIFRSFVIPWMQPNEVRGVVDFEASKYVPFALNDLSYSFHPMTVTEGNLRRIRIIFVAIKKAVLESYKQILEQAALRIHIAEPATLSLIRIMAAKELLPKEETVALIEMGDEMGNIIVVDNHMPQFVREFQLRVPGAAQENPDPQTIMTRMMNEVRISLNYFNRQEDQFKVKKLVFLSSSDPADILRRMEDDLHLPVISITTDSVLANAPSQDVNFLKAYGAALYPSLSLPSDLNLLELKTKTLKLVSGPGTRKVNYKSVVMTAVICVPIIVAAFFVTNFKVKDQELRSATLVQQLKTAKDVSAQKLRSENETLNKKLDYFKNLPMESDIAAFLAAIPGLLPDGVWVDQIDIVYPDVLVSDKDKQKEAPANAEAVTKKTKGKPAVDIQGYAYSSNPGDQFRLVNDLLANFKGNKELSTFFSSMDFESIQAKPYGKYPATFFHLKCR